MAHYPYRNHSLEVLERFLPRSPEVMTWVPQGGKNSIGWQLRHMYETEDFWIHQLAFGQSIVQPLDLTDAGALLAEYRRIRRATDERLAAATEAELQRVISVPTFADGWAPPCPPTLHWVFHHVFEHENYHMGQISMQLRLMGQKPLPF